MATIRINANDDGHIKNLPAERFGADTLSPKLKKNACKKGDEVCMERQLLRAVEKKNLLSFEIRRTDEGMKAYNELLTEKEKQAISEERRLHSVQVVVNGEGDTRYYVALYQAQILSLDMDAVNFRAQVTATEGSKSRI